MPTEILMPALSPTMEEGTLSKWIKQEGDDVAPGDVIAEIETDKATMEVEAVDEGVVEALLVDEGAEGVKVNAPIARLKGQALRSSTPSGRCQGARWRRASESMSWRWLESSTKLCSMVSSR